MRTWEIYTQQRGKNILGYRHRDFDDEDFLNSSFLFYDENADLVRVTVKDCLGTERLRYTYQEVEIPWLKSRPMPAKRAAAAPPKASTVEEPRFPVVLNLPFDLFVNELEGTEGLTPGESEFAGSFVTLPHKHKRKHQENEKKLKTALRLGITDLLEDIGTEDDESVLVRTTRAFW
ncbi:hypothetical protein ZIOFF_064979 [Zingiber officinale]|uniref:Polyphenol oxidase n=1 Tax=Zingiber officinale TaxID=94328 RepID=A0A8J5EWT4_ZINOF|nr:hypothetical protein ZIOFF_064979 [Zingiber officinale]